MFIRVESDTKTVRLSELHAYDDCGELWPPRLHEQPLPDVRKVSRELLTLFEAHGVPMRCPKCLLRARLEHQAKNKAAL